MQLHNAFLILILATLPVGVIHTLLGPDHYLPFIVLARARNWSMFKTAVVTFFCGVGHVLSAAALGVVGVFFGIAMSKIKIIEAWRSDIAAWALIIFGAGYLIFSGYKIVCQRHDHQHEHQHFFKRDNLTPWVLFIIFVLGPCEPLIPLILYPAMTAQVWQVASIVALFGVATIATMMLMVLGTVFGFKFLQSHFFSHYGNVMAGGIIFASGIAIKYFGI